MAGILEQKSRVIDVIFTPDGRRQILTGEARIKYASFSDSGAIYEGNSENILDQSSSNIGLESFSTQWDQVAVETDDNGKLFSFIGNEVTLTPDQKIILSGSIQSSILNAADVISESSLQAIKSLQLIKNKKIRVNDRGLKFSKSSHQFDYYQPFNGEPSTTFLEDIDPIFSNRKFSNNTNFLYLPPTQTGNNGGTTSLGNYYRANEKGGQNEILNSLKGIEFEKFESSKYTEENELIIQFFEEKEGNLTKLDVVPYKLKNKKNTLYFVGKVINDKDVIPKFVNIFTVVI